MSNTYLLEASSSAETLKMVSLIKGGNKEREVTSKACRLTALSSKCVKGEGSSKWILMHKLQGVLEPQSYKRQWKGQNPTQKMFAFSCLCISGVLVLGASETPWYFLRDEKRMRTLMSREEGCSEEKVLLLLLLHVQNISFITTGKALRAPATGKKKQNQTSQ